MAHITAAGRRALPKSEFALPGKGTGPEGKGKLFKISYTDKKAPQPALAYAVSPTETRVVFDLPKAKLWANNENPFESAFHFVYHR